MTDRSHDPAKTAAFYRRLDLDEEATQRHYFRYQDEEQSLWLWEAVPYQNELVAVKQIEVDPSGTVSRYWCNSWTMRTASSPTSPWIPRRKACAHQRRRVPLLLGDLILLLTDQHPGGHGDATTQARVRKLAKDVRQ